MQIHYIYRHIDNIKHPSPTRHKHLTKPFVRAFALRPEDESSLAPHRAQRALRPVVAYIPCFQ